MDKQYTELSYGGTFHRLRCKTDCDLDIDCVDCPVFEQAIDRLGEYEDTRLKPEQLDDFARQASEIRMASGCKTLEDCRKLVKEDRIVVLPCKVGDTVFIIPENYVREIQVFGFVVYYNYMTIMDNDINEWVVERDRVFLTREEAVAALAKEENSE